LVVDVCRKLCVKVPRCFLVESEITFAVCPLENRVMPLLRLLAFVPPYPFNIDVLPLKRMEL
jgi:hypothetical protein